jgi:acetoin utilization deacetylase AcuC-like enzyme
MQPVRVFYSPQYVGAVHAFETTRKSQWIVDSLAAQPIPNIELAVPIPLTLTELVTVHSPDYIRAVQTGQPEFQAESNGFQWDPGIWQMAISSNGGAVTAALHAMEQGIAGSLSSGLHHARRDHGAGFCTFNGLAIAAKAALAAGARSVLILDLDAHCGGGTASLIADEPRIRQLDISTNDFDSYRASPNIQLDVVERPAEYLSTIRDRLAALDRDRQEFDLCLYNAGMDPFGPIDANTLAVREQEVFQWCRSRRLPVAFVLAGGYLVPGLDQAGLVSLHRRTLEAAAATAASA